MIKHEGDKWILYTEDGSKVIGTHDTKEEAEAQERAIKATDNLKASKPIPILTIGKTMNGYPMSKQVYSEIHERSIPMNTWSPVVIGHLASQSSAKA